MATSAGASAIGLVAGMPSGPGVIEESLIADIASRTPPGVSSFLLTSETDTDAIEAQHRRCRTSVIQLTDWVEPTERVRLSTALPGVRIVQVVHVVDRGSIETAAAAIEGSDALLLDSGNPGLAIKELGGTGRVHDWSLSREIVASSHLPVFLAGGLRSENAGEAVRAVRPFGLDLCTGVRTDGHLDAEKLRRFMDAAGSRGL